jgi:hypothetical protein
MKMRQCCIDQQLQALCRDLEQVAREQFASRLQIAFILSTIDAYAGLRRLAAAVLSCDGE